MLAASGYKTKKVLKESVGKYFSYQETSCFRPEYPEDGTGKVTVVGPTASIRKWYATVTIENGIIKKVE